MLQPLDDFIAWLDYPVWVWWLIALYASLPVLVYVLLPYLKGNASTHPRVIICVLGDLGHSPRMCYHARSFAKRGYAVDLCGYIESSPPVDVVENDDIDIHEIKTTKRSVGQGYISFIVTKVVSQVWVISSLLWQLRGAQYVMVQNPPGLPVLLIATVFKMLTGSKLIIDWHNLGYSILAIKFGQRHPLVLIYKAYEHVLSRFSNINVTVTEAMKKFLIKEFGVKSSTITVLYDKAAAEFKPLTTEEKQAVIKKYNATLFDNFDTTRDKIVSTSTSFTPDEDMNVLLQGMKKYDALPDVPRVRVIITGKGPMKEEFERSVKESSLSKVSFRSAWLPIEDYPLVLGTADLGISLHTSSSGIDLPMKVVDMFGCGIPVLALDFPALPELVEHDVNGRVVMDAHQIMESMIFLFLDQKNYDVLKKGALEKSKQRWEKNWRLEFGDKCLVP